MRLRRHLTRAAVAVLLASMVIAPGPASATTAATLTFNGAMTTGPMGDLCTPIGTLNCDPLSLSGPTTSFAYSTTMCLATAAHVDAERVVAAPLCSFQANGVLTGFCGRASGTGSGVVAVFGGLGSAVFWVTFDLQWVSAQVGFNHMVMVGTVTREGGGTVGRVTGRWSMVPDPTSGSCVTQTAARWITEGNIAFEIVEV